MRRVTDLRLLLPLGGAALFLFFPAMATAGTAAGLRLAASVLIPSLFPVIVLSGCLLRMRPEAAAERCAGMLVRALFGLSGAGAVPLVLGLLGGYPLGARLVASMYREGRLTKSETVRLSALCNNAGPAFLLGFAGGVLGDPSLGAALVLIQLLSVTLTGLLLRKPGMAPGPVPHGLTEISGFGDALLCSIGDASAAMLTLTGTVAFFHAGLACLEALVPTDRLPPLLRATASGFLEISGGISLLRGTDLGSAFPLAAMLMGWGGCCVHLQAAAVLRAAGLPVGPYLRGKLLQGAICLLLAAAALPTVCGAITPVSALAAGQLLALNIFVIFKKFRWKLSASVL